MIIRHKRFVDVCFDVFKSTDKFTRYGRWLNMGYTRSWFVPSDDEWIKIDVLSDWEQCTTPEVKCLRYGTWVPL